MSADTLLTVRAPRLIDGMAELLRIADAIAAANLLTDCGVTVLRHPEDGHVIDAQPDWEVPAGVIVTTLHPEVPDPWNVSIPEHTADELRYLLEALHQRTAGDVVATPDGWCWL